MKPLINKHKPLSYLILGVVIFFASSCNSSKTSIIWVNSIKYECPIHTGKRQCISIHRNDEINKPWELFHENIEGFNFDSGYFQKIEIHKKHLDKIDLPADGSSIKYVLIKTLEKKVDQRFILNDIWVANRINGNTINRKSIFPRMEINLSMMQISGNNGCNNYTGKIERLTSSDILFGAVGSTKKMCPDMTISKMFDTALNTTKSYRLKNTELLFFDKDGIETLHFIKTD
jgi:heat shock protein HslJ